ncbi:MAG: hypothetical protein K8I82_26055, partial [Anaerolineae bacterium]|nr:hypothetical protein [Anaerolineae bacterium]
MFQRLQGLWENQPPLVRSNVSVGIMTLVGVLLLHLILPLIIRFLDIQQVFDYLIPPMDILSILIQLLFVLLALNALRVTFQFLTSRSVLTLMGVSLAWLSLVLIALAYMERPSVVEKYVGHAAGRSFGSVSQDFSELCEQWQQEWKNRSDDSAFIVNAEDIGALQGQEVYTLQDTVFINFGEKMIDVGLAC